MKEHIRNLKGWQVVLYNLIVFLLYGGVLLSEKDLVLLMAALALHFLVCANIEISVGKLGWLLISAAIALIGFSICTAWFLNALHH